MPSAFYFINIILFTISMRTGLEVIKLEFIFKLKIKRNVWVLADTTRVRKPPMIAPYFEARSYSLHKAEKIRNALYSVFLSVVS